MTVQDYLNLITSEHSQRPKFVSTISQIVGASVWIQGLLEKMIPLFDLDQTPMGQQEDLIGQWVGISRKVSIPVAGIFFSWDDVMTDGWDYGTWAPPIPPTVITALPDDAYLTLIRTKIAANYWDGTIEGAYTIWNNIFPQYTILFQDNQDMSYSLAVIGGIVDSLTLALLTGGYLPLRPEGVMIDEYFVATDTNRAFGWDVESMYLGGWDEGSWLREILV